MSRRRAIDRFNRSHNVMSDINVTPLVDVMLVLLIMFMVTAPLARHGMEIKLPSVSTKSIAKKETWSITIYKNQELHFNGKRISLDKLEARLQGLAKENPDVEVFLKADEGLSYGFVVSVMGATRRAGVLNLGMVTEPLTVIK